MLTRRCVLLVTMLSVFFLPSLGSAGHIMGGEGHGGGGGGGDSSPVSITEVATNFDLDTLTITGENFSFENTLEVTLGEIALNIPEVPTDTEIVVD